MRQDLRSVMVGSHNALLRAWIWVYQTVTNPLFIKVYSVSCYSGEYNRYGLIELNQSLQLFNSLSLFVGP